ncbi:MAG: DoxX family protein [Alphaproteobacteria bacterium]|nr:DoxX family protein [Alphaproteobacteria bacterium]
MVPEPQTPDSTRRPEQRLAAGRAGWLGLVCRLLMALLFLVSATTKVTETPAIQAYMHAFGVPESLVWPAAAWEYAAGTLLLAGYQLRAVSGLLAGWCLLTAAIFHTKFADLDQLMNFFKNTTMAGAFLAIAGTGFCRLSVDALLAGWRRSGH